MSESDIVASPACRIGRVSESNIGPDVLQSQKPTVKLIGQAVYYRTNNLVPLESRR